MWSEHVLSINDITAWGLTHPWANADQVEQDLLLSRAICAIADHDYLGTELIATKLRALYQRSKGRDLFDIWLALTTIELDPDDILTVFAPYRPTGHTPNAAIANLQAELLNPDFRRDLDELAAQPPIPYDPDQAADLVINNLLRHSEP
jgi:hypothetical protein